MPDEDDDDLDGAIAEDEIDGAPDEDVEEDEEPAPKAKTKKAKPAVEEEDEEEAAPKRKAVGVKSKGKGDKTVATGKNSKHRGNREGQQDRREGNQAQGRASQPYRGSSVSGYLRNRSCIQTGREGHFYQEAQAVHRGQQFTGLGAQFHPQGRNSERQVRLEGRGRGRQNPRERRSQSVCGQESGITMPPMGDGPAS